MNPPRAPPSPPQRLRRERGLLGALLVLLALLLAWERLDSRADVLAQEQMRLGGQARAIEQNLTRQLEAAYAAMVDVRQDLASWPPGQRAAAVSARLDALSHAMPGVSELQWLDADGVVRASSRPDRVGSDAAPGAAFRLAHARPDPALLVVAAPQSGVPGQPALSLAIAVVAPSGRFEGAITAALDRPYFNTVIASVRYAPDMRTAVVHGDGLVLVLSPPDARAGTLDVGQPDTPFGRHRAGGTEASVQIGPSIGGGELRLVAMRTVQPPSLPMDKALVVTASRKLDTVYAGWQRQTALLATLYLLSALAATWGLLAHQRVRAEREAQAAERQAQQAAHAERMALALRGGDLGLWDLDVPNRRATVNERWSTMLGYEPDAHATDEAGWQSLLHPDDRARVVAAQQAHIDGHTESYEAQYRMRHRDGSWVWVLDRGRVVERDANGVALRMVGTHMDVSEQHRMVEALRDREAQLSSLADALPGPVARIGVDGRYVYANAAYERWFGIPGPQLVGRHWHEVIPEPARSAIEPQFARALAGQTCSYDTTLDTLAGPRTVMEILVPDRDGAGVVRGCYVVVTDITERRRTEDALRLSEQKSRALLDALLSGVVVHAADSQVLDANPSACRILGLSLAQMRGKLAIDPAWRFLEEDGSAMALARYPVNQVLGSGEPLRNLVLGVRRPDLEHPLWVLCNAFALRDDTGAVQQVVVAFSDFTDRKRAEEERRLLERQLREAQKMESIGTLAGGIAHDFNNILAAILGNAALARDDLPPAHPAQQSLEQIDKAGKRARSLVQQILTFSRRQPNERAVQPLRPVVEETLALLRATLPAAVRLETRLADDALPVAADATQLQQVLMNLCTNAWHALPGGRGRVEIGLARVDGDPGSNATEAVPGGPYAHLWVADDGAGMDEGTRERIFDPFFTTKPVGQGTGLGLSVVHGIVSAHRGSITVDSVPGRGSTFHVHLPIARAAAAAPARVERPPLPAVPAAGQQVLYVDDDEVMVLMVQRLLQRAGYAVTTCADAAQALALVRVQSPSFDLVVSDFNMPGLSGTELAAELRRLQPRLPVVITTGYITEELRLQARRVGVRALLMKQHTLEELVEVVQQALAPV